MRTETIRIGVARAPSWAQRRNVSKYGALRHAAGAPGSTKAVMCPPSLVTRMSFERSGFQSGPSPFSTIQWQKKVRHSVGRVW
jgi:hypothetical protein